MSHNGTWGGDLEINAISNYYKCNVIVFQDSRPNLELQTFPKDSPLIQLAYFGSCHYNSVRSSKPLTLSDKSSKGNIVLRSDEQEALQKKEAGKVPKVQILPKAPEPKKKKLVQDKQSIFKRNVLLIEQYRKKIDEVFAKKPKQCDQWCGDLSFDDLISTENRVRILQLRRERQVKCTLELLTRKCPCKSGAYFKFCCYPKMKAWY